MVAEPTYRPDAPGEYLMTEERDGVPVPVCNTYRGSSLKPVEGDVTPRLKYVEMIAGGRDYVDECGCNGYQFLLDYLSYLVQYPGKKVNYAPVLLGGEGEGKDLMLRPLVLALGQHNVATIDPNDTATLMSAMQA